MEKRMNDIRAEIKKRAAQFCKDNKSAAGREHEIETTMLIGASIVFEIPDEDVVNADDGWRWRWVWRRCPCGQNH